jgi:TATA-binding protein-associated factor Taf7
MDVLDQAMNVAERAEAAAGRVTLTLDLDEPGQRAAYAAALAVLQINGVDVESLALSQPADVVSGETRPAGDRPKEEAAETGSGQDSVEAGEGGEESAPDDERDPSIRRSYAEAVSELTTDEARQRAIVRDTYPRVRDLLRDGANVEAVAQIQYRRWAEEHLDTSRN